jgi:hypothetical protein
MSEGSKSNINKKSLGKDETIVVLGPYEEDNYY